MRLTTFDLLIALGAATWLGILIFAAYRSRRPRRRPVGSLTSVEQGRRAP